MKPRKKASDKTAASSTDQPSKPKQKAIRKSEPKAEAKPKRSDAAKSKPIPAPKSTSSPSPGSAPKETAAPSKPAPHSNRPKPDPRSAPSVLFEPDPAPPSPAFAPDHRRSLSSSTEPGEQELPDSYETGRLFLSARDPKWLYASWDMSDAQIQKHNANSVDGHLILRVIAQSPTDNPVIQIHLRPTSKSWFVYTGKGGVKYIAELGYNGKEGRWITLAKSGPAMTPSGAMAPRAEPEFATVPAKIPLNKIVETVKAEANENKPLAQALKEAHAKGTSPVEFTPPPAPQQWTPEQEQRLAEIIRLDESRRVWVGSLDVTELVQRHLARESGPPGGPLMSPAPDAVHGEAASHLWGQPVPREFISSHHLPLDQQPGDFWFSVNAELIIYGATEPSAKVVIGGSPVQLRPDGSFSFRFALPDGRYELPIVAASATRPDTRAAKLSFGRETQFRGEVRTHPQDASLKPPNPDDLS